MFAQLHPTFPSQSEQHPPESADPLTWPDITELEPRVLDIIDEALAIENATWLNYSLLKASLARLVGFDAEDPRLAAGEAYDIAVHELLEALGL